MNFKELLKLHIVKRLPAAVLSLLLCGAFSLYYVGAFDLSFIERPESWEDNLSEFKAMFIKEEKPDAPDSTEPSIGDDISDDETEDNIPSDTPSEKPDTGTSSVSKADRITFKTVDQLKEEGYSLTDKVWDENCVIGKLTCDFDWPLSYSYGEKTFFEEKLNYYEDGKEADREIVSATCDRPALETYMGYIIYDDRGKLYLLNSSGEVMREYDDTEYLPAYTRDLEGRPLFYKKGTTDIKYPKELSKPDAEGNRTWISTLALKVDEIKYYYLSENGQRFVESDYNDVTDNRGLYFDYPAYYGNGDSKYSRYFNYNTVIFTSLEYKTRLINSVHWMYSKDPVELSDYSFDLHGNNLKDKDGKTLEELFPYTAAYNYSEGYATVRSDIHWDYYHEKEKEDGTKENEYVEVVSNELRVINESGKAMFASRKNYFSELGWTANERYTDPLSRGIDSIGSYYFDNGLMRLRVQSYDRFYFTDLDTVYIVSDDDILVRPDGSIFTVPSGYTLKAYSDGILLLEKDGSYRYLKSNGVWLWDEDFSDGKTFLEGLAVCARNGKYGMITKQGKVVIPFEYDSISTVSSGTVTAYKKGEGWSVFQKLSK